MEQVKEYLGNGTLTESDLAWQEGMSDWLPLKEVISPSDLPPKSKLAPPPPVANPLATNLHVATPETTQPSFEVKTDLVKRHFFARSMGISLIIATLGIVIFAYWPPTIVKTNKEIFTGEWHAVIDSNLHNPVNVTSDGKQVEIRYWNPDKQAVGDIDGTISIIEHADSKSIMAYIYIDGKESPFFLSYDQTGLYYNIITNSEVHSHKLEPGLVSLTENAQSAKVIAVYKHDTGNQVYETITLFDNGTFTYDNPDYVFKHDGGTYTVDYNKNIFFSGSKATVFASHGQISPEDITFPWYSFARAQ